MRFANIYLFVQIQRLNAEKMNIESSLLSKPQILSGDTGKVGHLYCQSVIVNFFFMNILDMELHSNINILDKLM